MSYAKAYNLTGGTLTAGTVTLTSGTFTKSGGGLNVTTAFNQGGGTNSFDTLTIDTGDVTKYNLTSGTLGATTVNLNAGGTYAQSAGTATIGTFNYNGGTMTLPSSAAGTITTFGYNNLGTMLPTHLNAFTITNFAQTAGSLTFSPLTLVSTPGSGTYNTYTLQGGTLNAGAATLSGNSNFTQTGGTLNYTSFTQNTGSTGIANFDYTNNVIPLAIGSGQTYYLKGGTLQAGTVNLNAGGTYNQSAGTATIGTFNYNGGTMTLPSSAAGTITTFGYNNSGSTLPASLNQFTITNFSQTAGNLNIPTLTIQATPASGIYSTYNLSGGSLTADTVALSRRELLSNLARHLEGHHGFQPVRRDEHLRHFVHR